MTREEEWTEWEVERKGAGLMETRSGGGCCEEDGALCLYLHMDGASQSPPVLKDEAALSE